MSAVLGQREAWCYTNGDHEERSFVVLGTRFDVIAEGQEANDGGAFLIAKCREVDGHVLLPSAERLMEQALERAEDEFGDDAVEFIEGMPKEACAELDQALKAWAAKHMARKFYEQVGPYEHIPAQRTEEGEDDAVRT